MAELYSLDEVGAQDGQSKVDVKELKYPPLPPTRTDLGYSWSRISVAGALGIFSEFLTRNNARAYLVDVYASNDAVYRNIVIQLPEDGFFSPEAIELQFNKHEGRQYILRKG